MACVDSGFEFKSILVLVDLPYFNDSFRLITDGVLDTAAAGEEISLQSEDFSITVNTWMLFFSHEYIFIEESEVIKVSCSVEEQNGLISKCMCGECAIDWVNCENFIWVIVLRWQVWIDVMFFLVDCKIWLSFVLNLELLDEGLVVFNVWKEEGFIGGKM